MSAAQKTVDASVKKSKADRPLRRYTILHALLVGLACFGIAALVGQAIEGGYIKHSFDILFAPAAVGMAITILNFKPLSKFSIVLLPPAYAMTGFAVFAGPLLLTYFNLDKERLGATIGMAVETVPFFILHSMLYRWYSSLARNKSSILYLLYAVFTVVVSFLIFGDHYPLWLLNSIHLGVGAFLFSLLHLKRVL